ncbi:hypothetical protein [Phytomonospora endophytica]|uniref:Uncharacterized protein n=1 Tax=Phytomonospora endophytica TaxID=714109 RepID=A0A841FXX4_9ACTN|nr:hypothetical protein [Phytomonospora endophytica]MBB6036820.1 hypothetical protein [Phytomonospora endophytica]GIG68146.1 hypothetical protein Pen01_44410 [Phytomonospora endophytica]
MLLTKQAAQVLRAMAAAPGGAGTMRPVGAWLSLLPFDAPTFVQAIAELGGKTPPLVNGRTEGEGDEEIHVVGLTQEGLRQSETAETVD